MCAVTFNPNICSYQRNQINSSNKDDSSENNTLVGIAPAKTLKAVKPKDVNKLKQLIIEWWENYCSRPHRPPTTDQIIRDINYILPDSDDKKQAEFAINA